MVRNYKRKNPAPSRPYTEAFDHCKLLLEGGSSIRDAAKTAGISEATLRRRLNAEKRGKEIAAHPGQPTSLPLQWERELALMLTIKAKCGFAFEFDDVADLVRDFIKDAKECHTAEAAYLEKYNLFKDDRPGRDWMSSFMKRYGLSYKLPNPLEKARMTAASNPEIIALDGEI